MGSFGGGFREFRIEFQVDVPIAELAVWMQFRTLGRSGFCDRKHVLVDLDVVESFRPVHVLLILIVQWRDENFARAETARTGRRGLIRIRPMRLFENAINLSTTCGIRALPHFH